MPVTARPSSTSASGREQPFAGFAAALCAFLAWGLAPIYFKAVGAAGPVEILAHRVVWTVILIACVIAAMGRTREAIAELARPRRLAVYLATTALISSNWLIYIYAVLEGHILQASLGYFINPLVNVLLGMLFLSERLNRRQSLSVGLACIGVGYQVAVYGAVPWVSLMLAFSFGFYALFRKRAAVDPYVGLLVETLLLLPAAAAYLIYLAAQGTGQFLAGNVGMDLLLIAAGVITGAPLVLFMIGAQRLSLSTIGLMQYLAPTVQLLLAVAIYGEPFTAGNLVTFGFIWAALLLYSWDAISTYRRQRPAGYAV